MRKFWVGALAGFAAGMFVNSFGLVRYRRGFALDGSDQEIAGDIARLQLIAEQSMARGELPPDELLEHQMALRVELESRLRRRS